MVRQGDNNPRLFAETVSLATWRTPFEDGTAIADLFIDVGFFEKGRVGGDGDPVRFRLSLKRAEVHVETDVIEILKVQKSSIVELDPPEGTVKETSTTQKSAGGKVNLGASLDAVEASAALNAEAGIDITKTTETTSPVRPMWMTHRKTDEGYAFVITPVGADRLIGKPLAKSSTWLRVKDTGASRKFGEPPEMRIQIRCRREDLIFEDIQFADERFDWGKLDPRKRKAVEAFLGGELARMGFPCGELSDPFASVVVADAVTEVE